MCSRSLFLSNRREPWQGMGTRKSQPYPRRNPWQGTGTRKSQPYPRREPWQGTGKRKSQPYPRREPWQGTGTRKSPPYPGRKREELNVENADGLKKSCGMVDNTIYWNRRE